MIDHNCDITRQITTAKLLSEITKPDVTDFGLAKPKARVHRLANQHHINATYMQAYRSLKTNWAVNFAEEMASYCLVKPWLEWMCQNNNRSVFDYLEATEIGEEIPRIE